MKSGNDFPFFPDLFVIPGSPRNPVFSICIPAFAGMTARNERKDVSLSLL